MPQDSKPQDTNTRTGGLMIPDPWSMLTPLMHVAMILLSFLSIIPMVFLRKNLGFRVLKPWVFCVTFLGLMVLGAGSGLFNFFRSSSAGAAIIPLFSLAFLGLCVWQRRQGWQRIKRGENWHSMSRGQSHLAVLPIPENILQVYVEPVLWLVVGLVLMPVSFTLGYLLFMSGVALGLMEQLVSDMILNNLLDQADAQIEARMLKENVTHFQSSSTPRNVGESAGMLVRFSPEVEEKIQRVLPPPIAPLQATAAAAGATLPSPLAPPTYPNKGS